MHCESRFYIVGCNLEQNFEVTKLSYENFEVTKLDYENLVTSKFKNFDNENFQATKFSKRKFCNLLN